MKSLNFFKGISIGIVFSSLLWYGLFLSYKAIMEKDNDKNEPDPLPRELVVLEENRIEVNHE